MCGDAASGAVVAAEVRLQFSHPGTAGMGAQMNWLGIDIGGANLKLSDGAEYARSRSFPIWQRPGELTQELRHAISEAPACDRLVITMTGELADCFASKTEGVLHILDAVDKAADGRHTRVYLTDGRFVTPVAARRTPLTAAASNWHALASFVRRYISTTGLLVDVGSTTTDIVPVSSERVLARGTNDTERLVSGELWYSGVERSPVCAVTQSVPYRDSTCSVAQEYFATMRDVYLVTVKLPESPSDLSTADGRPATKAFAKARLGRMICADETQFHHRDAAAMAQFVADLHASQLGSRLTQVADDQEALPTTVVTSGGGEFLAKRALQELDWEIEWVSLNAKLGSDISKSAAAYALAVLAAESRSS